MSSPIAAHSKTLLSAARHLASAEPIAASVPHPASATVIRQLALRAKPIPTALVVDTVLKDEVVTVKSKQGRWWLIIDSRGLEGWVLGNYLTLSNSDAPVSAL